jgi:hypothetical protein
MAIAYHFAFFTEVNSAAWLFGAAFTAGALWFVWMGVVKSELQFRWGDGIRGWSGGFLIGFVLILYPLLGYALGHHYPAVPTFGLPCPTTIFSIGMLLFLVAPTPRSVFIVPLLWALVGFNRCLSIRRPRGFRALGCGVSRPGSCDSCSCIGYPPATGEWAGAAPVSAHFSEPPKPRLPRA